MKKFLIISIITFSILIPVIFFLLSNSPFIQVKSESKYYTIHYLQSEKLDNYLKKWGILESNLAIYAKLKHLNSKKIKKISIVLTDIPQRSPVLTDINDHVLFSETTKVDIYRSLSISVYIDPQLRKSDLVSINKNYTLVILNSLFKMAPYNKNKGLEKDFTAANKDLSTPGNQPFTIGVQHE